MSDKPLPKKTAGIPIGAVGLVFTIIFCVGIAVSPNRFSSVFLNGVLGFAGLVTCVVGIAKRSGRVAGVLGIFAFLLGCLMTYAVLLDLIAHERGNAG
jgi:hypothetical protein